MAQSPQSDDGRPQAHHTALVLAGGAARGAYEVGVVRHVVEDVARSLGRDVPLDLLCGTSVGAINVCALAAWADEPRARAARLESHWASLTVGDVVRFDGSEILQMFSALIGRARPPKPGETRRGGLLDPRGLEAVIARAIPFERIAEHLRAGRIKAVSVSATHVATGRTMVFLQRAQAGLPHWGSDPTTSARAVTLRAEHALASAALPLLFPAVRIDRHFFSDGGLRQNVPLSPARRLGADALVVVNPRHIAPPGIIDAESTEITENEIAFPGPFFLLGKTLNALLLDRIDSDIDRLERINKLLDAGTRHYGPRFVDELNTELGNPPNRQVRPLRAVLVRASQDIGCLAAEFVRGPVFARRTRGVLAKMMRRLAEGEARNQADLLSYLLFDGEFARQLVELGRADAAEHHEELCKLFERAVRAQEKGTTAAAG
jgi:NTE family protein